MNILTARYLRRPIGGTRRALNSSSPLQRARCREGATRQGPYGRGTGARESGIRTHEDHCQARTGHAPENLSTLRDLAIDTFRAAGHVNIAHARRHYTHQPERIFDLYEL